MFLELNIFRLLLGEGLLQGGVIVVSPLAGILYMHQEMTGSELPIEEIAEAIKSTL